MNSIKIEDGIPAPARKNAQKYPWDQLNVSQSFETPVKNIKSFRSMVSSKSRKTGHKYQTAVTDSGNMRVWRIA